MLRRCDPPSRFRQRGYLGVGVRRALGGGNAGGNSANAQNVFDAPLITTIAPARSAGGPTFTRATIATFTDWESRVYPVLSGEVRFQGARRVYNQAATKSEDWTAVPYASVNTSASIASGITPPPGCSVVSRVTSSTVNAANLIRNGTTLAGGVASKTVVVSFFVMAVTPGVSATFRVDNEQAVVGTTQSGDLVATSAWQRVTVTRNNTSAAGNGVQSGGVQAPTSGAVFDLYVTGLVIEDATGQSNQNPSEYASVGVLSAPYQGANVDGVKYFATQNGNTVAANVVTEAVGAAFAPLGYLSEQASTNLVLQSEDFSTTWAAVGTPTRSAAATRCGSVKLDLIGDDSAAALEGYTQTVTFTGNAVKAISIYFAQGTSTSSVVRLRDTTAGADRLMAAITWTGAVPTVTMTTGTLIAVDTLGNSCFRARMLATSVTAANTNSMQVYPATDNALAIGATGNINFGGVQDENNALYCGTYIPTTTATVTKNFDNLTYPVAGNVATNNATISLEWTPEAAAQGTVYLWGSYVDANNSTAILHDGTNIIFRKRIGGVNTDATKVLAYVAGTTYKITARASSAVGEDIFVNGVIGTNNATTTAMQLGATFQLGADGNSASPDFSEKRAMRIWARALSAVEVATL